ncbi:hypothetical protein [Actinomadura hibisca]|uniref:hypothetical protein n=1 Tax=Actinomadura hibisca TaxID=68565 RepID=UPI00082FAD0A|nr:hypothetical protein [Actinomadura hibisca]
MIEEGPITVELALAELRRGVDVRLANLEGQLALLFQRNELHERQMADQTRLVAELEDRLSASEREQVTRGHLDNRFRHTVSLLSMLAAAASVAVALFATVLGP